MTLNTVPLFIILSLILSSQLRVCFPPVYPLRFIVQNLEWVSHSCRVFCVFRPFYFVDFIYSCRLLVNKSFQASYSLITHVIVTDIVEFISLQTGAKAGINERNPSSIAYAEQFPI